MLFKNKTLLITGGTGSFGNQVLKRFLDSDIKEIRIFSRDEKKQDDMRNEYNSSKIKFFIGDVRDFDSINKAMSGVNFVFHAAALKQVPSCEFYPLEAVKTNILGAENVINAAVQNGVEKLISLSTDKAVYPINAMGISKAMMEKLVVARSRLKKKNTIMAVTRYGNVMASRGSVIPLFRKQILSGQPLTVTDPNMTRFMMSLDDAIDLVIYAFKHAKGGEIFVQKSPASTIKDLAAAMLEVFNVNNEIKIIGTRHGEKLYETLLTKEERTKSIDLGQYFAVPVDARDLNYNQYFVEGQQSLESEPYTSHNTERLTKDQVVKLLLNLDYIKNQLKTQIYSEGY